MKGLFQSKTFLIIALGFLSEALRLSAKISIDQSVIDMIVNLDWSDLWPSITYTAVLLFRVISPQLKIKGLWITNTKTDEFDV